MTKGKRIYFASDFHLGAPDAISSLEREKKIVAWLDEIAIDAEEIFLVGDVLDYWFEYKQVVPRGFVRLFGKIAELTDKGIKVHWFTGNHDMWIFHYLPYELGIELHRHPVQRTFGNKRFYIAHGDGLGPGDRGYKMLKKVLANQFCQWMFARLHPNFGIWLMKKSSHTSRNASYNGKSFMGEDKEWLVIHSKEILKHEHVDFFIYGHRHLVLDIPINNASRYINLGDWISQYHYAVFDGERLELKSYRKDELTSSPST